jgi:hypothetical protein
MAMREISDEVPEVRVAIRLTGTKKVLTRFLASFKCLNPKCRYEQTEISRPQS